MPIYVLAHSLKKTALRNCLALADLPRFIRDQGFAGLEISDRQLSGQNDDWLRAFAAECHSRQCGLIIDGNVDFTANNNRLFQQEIAHAQRTMVMAANLGAGIMRLCIGGQALSVQKIFSKRRNAPAAEIKQESSGQARPGSTRMVQLEKMIMLIGHQFRSSRSAKIRNLDSKLTRAVNALKIIMPLAAERGLRLGIENHWGISGDPQNIVRIINEVGSPFLGTCPDLGNFPRGIEALAALRLLATHTVILHAKSYSFRADGEEKSIDYKKSLAIFWERGFAGPITVEYEGWGDDLRGCRLTRELILRHWSCKPGTG
jgi:sugar phosphate isomerase/epimerase